MQEDNFRGLDKGVFEKYLLLFKKQSVFSLNSMYHTMILTTADAIPKSSPSGPALSI